MTQTESNLNPRDNPEEVIHEELEGHEDVIEAVAELNLGKISEDAQVALEVLQDEDNDNGGGQS